MSSDQVLPGSEVAVEPAPGGGSPGPAPAAGPAAAAPTEPAAERAGPPAVGRRRHAGAAPPAVGRAVARQLPAVIDGVRRGAAAARRYPLATAGLALLVVMTAFCFLGPLVYHTDQTHVFLRLANLSPRAGHPFGTDSDGNDELGRLMVGGQASLEVGAAAGLLAAVLGTLWGAAAGYAGGWLDAIMMRIVDAGIAIPTIVVLLVITSVYRPTQPVLVLVIAVTSWLGTARLIRAEALTLRTRHFVEMVRVMGGGGARAVVRHIAPNAIGTIVVNVTFQVANAILMLATLSFLGLGVQFPAVDWGNMIYLAFQLISDGYWWQVLAPGAAIMLVVVACTMLGDALRDALKARAGGR